MRVIAGKAKGIRLDVPKIKGIRPTLERAREALFSILGQGVAGARFLDLYAGTGANGIEALSRGAAFCTFVDRNGLSIKTIQRNLERAHLRDLADCYQLALPEGLQFIPAKNRPYHMIFADPPRQRTNLVELFRHIHDNRLLTPGGLIILEHPVPCRENLGEIPGYSRTRTASYGQTALSFFVDRAEVVC